MHRPTVRVGMIGQRFIIGIISGIGILAGGGYLLMDRAPDTAVTTFPPQEETPKSSAEANQPPRKKVAKADDGIFEKHVVPYFAKYCNSCHGGTKQTAGVALDLIKDEKAALTQRELWEKVKENLEQRLMPPKNKPQPSPKESAFVMDWVERQLAQVDCTKVRNSGRVTMRRLNRAEYDNTIRDLVGVDFHPAEDFPADDVGYGFDNIGDVLSIPPLLLEKYLAAADKILTKAIVESPSGPPSIEKFRLSVQQFSVQPRSAKEQMNRRIFFATNGTAFINNHLFSYTGEYLVRVRIAGDLAGNELPKLEFRVDGKLLKTFTTKAPVDKPESVEFRFPMELGTRKLEFAYTNDFFDEKAPDPKKKDRNLYFFGAELEGPFNAKPKPLPESHTRIMIAKPEGSSPAAKERAARMIVAEFARKAYRRPVSPNEIDRLLRLFRFADQRGEGFEAAVRHMLKAVLCSPHFLFRIELDPPQLAPGQERALTDFELASRLSYFLWSSMPDEQLFQIAAQGKLHEPAVLRAQVMRMLKDPRASALTTEFAAQWLNLRNLSTFQPDKKQFPLFDEPLRAAMIRETELFFEHIARNDRPVTDFLDANYTFLNERLARHYGRSDVRGDEFRLVKQLDDKRGGVITQASILALTSNPTRTSPVKRGKWILENLLGTPPPPPPPGAGELEDGEKHALTGSLRQRMEQHRSNPNCASCHQRLDPLGFGLENFNAIGEWRLKDGNFKIDSSGTLPDGASFQTPAQLRKILLGKSEQFRKCLAEKLLTFALGRGLEFYDRCALEEIIAKLKADHDKFSALIIAVCESDPFRKRRAKEEIP